MLLCLLALGAQAQAAAPPRPFSPAQRQRLDQARKQLEDLAGLRAQRRYDEAIGRCAAALATYRELLGENDPEVACGTNRLAVLYLETGRPSQARVLLEEERRRARGKAAPETLLTLINLCDALIALGRADECRSLIQQADALARQLELNGPVQARLLGLRAAVCKSCGEYAQGVRLLERASEHARVGAGKDSLEHAESLNNLAFFLIELGDYGRALPLLEQAHTVVRSKRGERHTDTVLNNLA